MTLKICKVIFVCLVSALMVLGCATTSSTNLKLNTISGSGFTESCRTPSEWYDIPPWRLGMPAKVVRHTDCMGVQDMLIVIHPAPSNEVTMAASRLLALMYVDNKEKAGEGREKLNVSYLKTDMVLAGGNNIYLVFFELAKSGE